MPMSLTLRRRPGYTLIEISVVIFIIGILFTLVLANYRRSSQDSVLQREASLVMARVRLAQEYASAGKTLLRCGYYSGNQCFTPNVTDVCLSQYPPPQPQNSCGVYTSGFSQITEGEMTPVGGYAVTFSCPQKKPDGSDVWAAPTTVAGNFYPLFYNANAHYGFYADNRGCKRIVGSGYDDGCFPAQPHAVSVNDQPTLPTHDAIITSFNWTSHPPAARFGDTVLADYPFDARVALRDIRLTSRDTAQYSCSKKKDGTLNTGVSPWVGTDPYTQGDLVEAGYPLQASVFFLPPDGRTTLITDNVAVSPPSATGKPDATNPWTTAEIMLGITKRNSDCQVVQVTSTGAVSRRIDADCDFST